jgi:SAM-dependent methyltransferase
MNAQSEEWKDYYEITINGKPCNTLQLAQQYFHEEGKQGGFAIDLGAGAGRDTFFLLKQGWSVIAIDAEELALEILASRVEADEMSRLDLLLNTFSTMVLPSDVDLVNASFSLPFCAPADFSACWQKIVDSLAVGGRFSGQLFGDRDEWSSTPELTFHTEEQMRQLFAENFEIEYLKIQDELSQTADGTSKHWHVFHIVAKKIK